MLAEGFMTRDRAFVWAGKRRAPVVSTPLGASRTTEPPDPPTPGAHMFFFFSNRLGCAGSILLSVALTAVLLLVFAR